MPTHQTLARTNLGLALLLLGIAARSSRATIVGADQAMDAVKRSGKNNVEVRESSEANTLPVPEESRIVERLPR